MAVLSIDAFCERFGLRVVCRTKCRGLKTGGSRWSSGLSSANVGGLHVVTTRGTPTALSPTHSCLSHRASSVARYRSLSPDDSTYTSWTCDALRAWNNHVRATTRTNGRQNHYAPTGPVQPCPARECGPVVRQLRHGAFDASDACMSLLHSIDTAHEGQAPLLAGVLQLRREAGHDATREAFERRGSTINHQHQIEGFQKRAAFIRYTAQKRYLSPLRDSDAALEESTHYSTRLTTGLLTVAT